MGDSQEFCLRWSSYQQQLGEALRSLLDRELLVDVTLACEGRSLRAHRTILSACSHYFQELFQENTHPHPIVILKDVKFEELEALVRFMYHGEVTMNNESLPGFLRTAETLHIRGLTGGSIASKRCPPQPLGKVDVEGVLESAAASEESHTAEEVDGPGDPEGLTDGTSSPETKRIKLEQVSPVSKSPPKPPLQQFSNDLSMGEPQGSFPVESSPNRVLVKADDIHSPADLASPREIVGNKTLSLEGLSQLVLPVLQDESSSTGQYFMNQGPGIGGNMLPLSQPSANNHGLVSRPFRHRVLWNHDQLLQLETWYRADRYPTGQAMRQYADTLAAMCPTASPTGASPTRQNVDYWFQNRRRKDSHPEVMQQREKKKLAKTLWGQILDQRGQGTS